MNTDVIYAVQLLKPMISMFYNGAAKWKAVLNLSTFRPEPFVAER